MASKAQTGVVVTTQEIEANLGLVHQFVNSHPKYWMGERLCCKDDIIGWGTFGLIHALQHFDPDLGFKFSTYGMKCIWGYVLQGLRGLRKEIWYGKEQGKAYITIPLDDVWPSELGYNNENKVIDKLDIGRVLGCEALTDRQREIVVLMLENDWDQAEVARITGKSRQNVHTVMNYAVRAIRTSLGVK